LGIKLQREATSFSFLHSQFSIPIPIQHFLHNGYLTPKATKSTLDQNNTLCVRCNLGCSVHTGSWFGFRHKKNCCGVKKGGQPVSEKGEKDERKVAEVGKWTRDILEGIVFFLVQFLMSCTGGEGYGL